MKLRKIVLHEGNEVLQQNEMKMIRGGETTYNCIRTQKVGENAFMCYTFTCQGEKLKNSWLDFWTLAGWDAAFVDTNKNNSNLYLC